jgi:DNA polymerase-3 subunit gamma/tau
VGQEAIAATLANALRSGRIAPAYLFSGPRGTGKTSSARILARSLNCIASAGPTPEPCGSCELCRSIAAGNALDVIEIDAASNTGVDNIRELIERSRFAPVQARWKVYVVDECHMLSTAAFNALLKTLEEPPPRVVFVLATTDPQRVLPTILSRCQRFDFRRIPLEALEQHLRWIATQESIGISPEALRLVAQRAQGGLRDAESLLDQLSLLPPPVDVEAVWELLGAVPEQELLQLAQAMAAREPLGVVETCRDLMDRGREAGAVLQGLASLLRDLLLAGVAPDRLELTSVSPSLRPELPGVARAIGKARLLHWQAQLKGSEQQLRHSVQPRLWLEVLLLGLLAEAPTGSAEAGTSIPAGIRVGATPSAPPAASERSPVEPRRATSAESETQPAASSKPLSVAAEADNRNPAAMGDSAGATAPEAAGHQQNLGELWHQILASLELPSTRMLLSQQAHLHRLDDRRAVVRVAGNWIAMVQTRRPLLEKAMARALGSPRAITLEAGEQRDAPEATAGPVASSPSSSSGPPLRASQPAAAPQQPHGPAERPTPATEPAPQPALERAPQPPGESNPIAVPAAPAHNLQADPPSSAATTPLPDNHGNSTAESEPAAAQAADQGSQSRIDEKARLFASFFNGEVISGDGA